MHLPLSASFRRPLMALASLVALSSPAAAASLFVNGSFETPFSTGNSILGSGSTAVTGWTTVLSGVEHFNATAFGGAFDGQMVVDLANYTYSAGGIEQTVATTAGQRYDVSFAAGNVVYGNRTGTGVVRVAVDGQAVGDFDTAVGTAAGIVWAQRSFSFVATGSSSTVRFWNEQNANQYFAFIDAVDMQAAPVPEPASAALLLAGGLALARLARSRRGCAGGGAHQPACKRPRTMSM
jgi:hypothetical protein